MGALRFVEFEHAASAKEAFGLLVQAAEYEFGHNAYNGTISTTLLVPGTEKVADKWGKEAEEAALALAEERGWGEKWESRAIDCGAYEAEDALPGERMWAFYGWASH